MRKTFTLLSFIVWVCSLASCGSSTKKGNTEDTTTTISVENEPTPQKPKTDPRVYNDLARYIAGLKGKPGSKYAQYEKDKAWDNYAKYTAALWKKVTDEKLPTMIDWQKQELRKANKNGGTLLYPFSGADFLHAWVFFPKAEKTVMIGLEPIGALPQGEQIAKEKPQNYFNNLAASLSSVLNFSFFKTKEMAYMFSGKADKRLDGTLPTILFFMARTHHKILDYEKVALSKNGRIISASEVKASNPDQDTTFYGNKLVYQAKGDNTKRTLYYFSANLADKDYDGMPGLSQREDLMNFLNGLSINATFLKSASYLMYKPYFSIIRRTILRKTSYLLQDDSGIPVKYMIEDNKWALTFYGKYIGPIALFANYTQPALKSAYEPLSGEKVRPLPFGIGYQYKTGTSNLMLAREKSLFE
ncbi:hypothetical protein [Microscilla marina]|uniref:Lipoprotein, putative n=1 Tax=Microscilla marina ATCC 23134 TaxID=313606 RepID=A1ZSN4_MICM2|nr:hypothetical protein [Microscilla marina]EAY26614.1 lipoprotein, putative [Microscilla marina ATCC 23134]